MMRSTLHWRRRACVALVFALICVAGGVRGHLAAVAAGEPISEAYVFALKWGAVSPPGQFKYPAGVATGADGTVYVADTDNHRVQRFSPDGTLLTQWGGLGSGEGEFRFPHGLEVGADGSVYVADTWNHRIQKFDADGSFLATWGGEGADDGRLLRPQDVAVDGSLNLYVADTYNHRIQRFDADGDWTGTWGSEGSGDGEFNQPMGVAVGGDGYVYVADTLNRRIQMFDAEGSFLAAWGREGLDEGDLDWPSGVAVDDAGNVYVADSNNHAVQKYDAKGQYIGRWGSSGSGAGQFDLPGAVAVAGSSVFVADTHNQRIQQFDLEGNFLSQWGREIGVEGEFHEPVGVAVDTDGNVYVADADNARIQKFDSNGSLLTTWGSQGSGDGELDRPTWVAVDNEGLVYVSDTDNHRIQKFDSVGNFVTAWGTVGSADGEFLWPAGVAVDGDGNVYVADGGNHRIQKFDSNGSVLATWGSQGRDDGQFNTPIGVAVDGQGLVYVADSDNNRIQEFDAAGNWIGRWGSQGGDDRELALPHGVAVDHDGNVYVADSWHNRIVKFDADGSVVTWGDLGSSDGLFYKPLGVAVDTGGNVYVADSGSHRIQKFVRAEGWVVDSRSGPNDSRGGSGPYDTGVSVHAGDLVQITAVGTFFDGTSTIPSPNGLPGRYGVDVTPFGPPIVANVATDSLVGSIGPSFSGSALLDDGSDINPATGQTGAELELPGLYGPGFVGSSFSATVPAGISGSIFLAINDPFLEDNRGELVVTIVTTPTTRSGVTGSKWLDGIPLPTEVSTEPAVVGTNLGLALLFALAFGLTSALFNATIEENEKLIYARVTPLLAPLRRAAKERTGPGEAPWMRFARPTLLLLLSALLYAFLDAGFGLHISGAVIVLSLFVALAVLVYSYEGTQALLGARLYGLRARFQLFPVALAFGVACVLLTRWLDFHPGYLYGFVAGFAFVGVTEPETPRRRAYLVLGGAAALLAASLLAWGLAVPVSRLAQGGFPGASLLYGILGAIFVAGLEGLLFALVPLTFMDGSKVLAWSRIVWGLAFGLVAWLFFHVLINPASAYLQAFGSKKVQLMLGTLATYSLLTVGTWLFFRWYAGRRAPRPAPVQATGPTPPPVAEEVIEPALPPPVAEAGIEWPAPPPLGEAQPPIEPPAPPPVREQAIEPAVPLLVSDAAIESVVPPPLEEEPIGAGVPPPVEEEGIELAVPPPVSEPQPVASSPAEGTAPPERPPPVSELPPQPQQRETHRVKISRPRSLSVMAICNFVVAALCVIAAIAFILVPYDGKASMSMARQLGGFLALLALASLPALVGWAAWTQKGWVYYILLIQGIIILPILLFIPGSLWLSALRDPRTQIALGRIGKKEIVALKPLAQEAIDTGRLDEAALLLRLYLEASPLALDREEIEDLVGGIESRLRGAPGPPAAAQVADVEAPPSVAAAPMFASGVPLRAGRAAALWTETPAPGGPEALRERVYPWHSMTWLWRLVFALFAVLWFLSGSWSFLSAMWVTLVEEALGPSSVAAVSVLLTVMRFAIPAAVLLGIIWPPKVREIELSAGRGVIFRLRNGQEEPVIAQVGRLRQLPGAAKAWEVMGLSPTGVWTCAPVFMRGISAGLQPARFDEFMIDLRRLVAPGVEVEPPPRRFRVLRWLCNILGALCILLFLLYTWLRIRIAAVLCLLLGITSALLAVLSLWRRTRAAWIWSVLIGLAMVAAVVISGPAFWADLAQVVLPRVEWPFGLGAPAEIPASTFSSFQGDIFSFEYPSNWKRISESEVDAARALCLGTAAEDFDYLGGVYTGNLLTGENLGLAGVGVIADPTLPRTLTDAQFSQLKAAYERQVGSGVASIEQVEVNSLPGVELQVVQSGNRYLLLLMFSGERGKAYTFFCAASEAQFDDYVLVFERARSTLRISGPVPTATRRATATVPAATPTSGLVTYTVRAGDTLGKIAAQFGVTVAAIVEANNIEDPSLIQVGQVLVIPGAGSGE